MAQPQKVNLKTPEGRYNLVSAKTSGSVMFSHKRGGTRMTLARVTGGAEDGTYILYNVAEYLHIAPFNRTDGEPLRSLMFNPSAVRDGYPTCHAHYPSAKDGVDTLVGIANGEVLVLSLRLQLQGPQNSVKAVVAATLNADNAHDAYRCVAVAWVPRSNGSHFLAAHSDGIILVYKKTAGMVGDGAGKLLSQISSKGSSTHPVNSITVPGNGINDVAFNPDGTRLAVACRDGGCRLLDWPSGNCVAGFYGYYGGLLCCCWSPDGQYVATGGEDDLLTVYSVADRLQIAFGEGHSSWISRVAFDPWQMQDSTGADGTITKTYRLASVGHDLQLCLWDLAIEDEVDAVLSKEMGRMKRVASASQIGLQAMGGASGLSGYGDSSTSHGGAGGSSGEGGSGGMTRQGSSSLLSSQRFSAGGAGGGSGSGIHMAASVPWAEMVMVQPMLTARIHPEPLFDLLFTQEALFTSCGAGQIRCWLRPAVWAASQAAAGQQQGSGRR